MNEGIIIMDDGIIIEGELNPEKIKQIEIFLENNNGNNYDLVTTFTDIGIFALIIYIIIYILYCYGLYITAKKMGVKYYWMAWIPLLQYYLISKVANKSFLNYLLYPFLYAVLLAPILATIIAGFVAGYSNEAGTNPGISAFILSFGIIILSWLYFLIMYIKLLHSISKRTGGGIGSTIGLLFVPWIMFPIIGYTLKYEGEVNENNQIIENKKEL